MLHASRTPSFALGKVYARLEVLNHGDRPRREFHLALYHGTLAWFFWVVDLLQEEMIHDHQKKACLGTIVYHISVETDGRKVSDVARLKTMMY